MSFSDISESGGFLAVVVAKSRRSRNLADMGRACTRFSDKGELSSARFALVVEAVASGDQAILGSLRERSWMDHRRRALFSLDFDGCSSRT